MWSICTFDHGVTTLHAIVQVHVQRARPYLCARMVLLPARGLVAMRHQQALDLLMVRQTVSTGRCTAVCQWVAMHG